MTSTASSSPPLHRAGLPFDHGNCRNFCRGSLVSLFFHASPPPPPPGSCRRNVGGTRGQGGEFLSAFGSLARSPPPCPEGMGERVREKGRGGDDRLEISGWSRARDKRYGSSATWATINFSHEVRSLSSSPPPPANAWHGILRCCMRGRRVGRAAVILAETQDAEELLVKSPRMNRSSAFVEKVNFNYLNCENTIRLVTKIVPCPTLSRVLPFSKCASSPARPSREIPTAYLIGEDGAGAGGDNVISALCPRRASSPLLSEHVDNRQRG